MQLESAVKNENQRIKSTLDRIFKNDIQQHKCCNHILHTTAANWRLSSGFWLVWLPWEAPRQIATAQPFHMHWLLPRRTPHMEAKQALRRNPWFWHVLTNFEHTCSTMSLFADTSEWPSMTYSTEFCSMRTSVQQVQGPLPLFCFLASTDCRVHHDTIR